LEGRLVMAASASPCALVTWLRSLASSTNALPQPGKVHLRAAGAQQGGGQSSVIVCAAQQGGGQFASAAAACRGWLAACTSATHAWLRSLPPAPLRCAAACPPTPHPTPRPPAAQLSSLEVGVLMAQHVPLQPPAVHKRLAAARVVAHKRPLPVRVHVAPQAAQRPKDLRGGGVGGWGQDVSRAP
jgi:hypothetical protein